MGNLSDTDLLGAYLTRAELTNVRLNIADLSGAHLEWADLGGAYLEWANLSGVHLDGVDLRHAMGLSEAQLAKARSGTKSCSLHEHLLFQPSASEAPSGG